MQDQQEQVFDFANLLPNLTKLFAWLIYASAAGMFVFPFIALTIDKEFAFHFWILTLLNGGMLITLLIYKESITKLDNKKEEKQKQ